MQECPPSGLGGFGSIPGGPSNLVRVHVQGVKLLGRLVWRQPAVPAAGCSALSNVVLHKVTRAWELGPL